MEHHSSSTHYLMWKLQTNSINSFQPPPYFQDSFVWPPRSYRCSFCRREFRSAQALGGHMNVHRRDRARLKQSPPPRPLQQQQPPQPADHQYYYSNLFQEKSLLRANLTAPPQIINDDECDEDDDFVGNNVVGKRHKLMCSSERYSSIEEIDLELRLGYPAVKL